jgi:hypothetical protein
MRLFFLLLVTNFVLEFGFAVACLGFGVGFADLPDPLGRRWLSSYCVAILALSALSPAAWIYRDNTQLTHVVVMVLSLFHGGQSLRAGLTLMSGGTTMGVVHFLPALLCALVLLQWLRAQRD